MREILDQIAQMDHARARVEKTEDVAMGIVGGLGNVVVNHLQEAGHEAIAAQAHQRTVEHDVKTALATEVGREGARVRRAEINNRGQLERLQAGLQWADEHKWKLIMAGLGAIGGYYAIKLAYQYIQARMGKPTLVRETTRHGVSQSVYNFFSNLFNDEPERPTRLDDIVLTPDIERKINILADDAKQANAMGLPYQNLLFYGPPGTGKTEFARRLAVYSDMDVAILSGADVAQFPNGEGITEIHKLFAWAETSQRGLLIFIDEAEACFRDRATLDSEGINIVNAFLSHTGSNSTKFMLVLATNYEDELDRAVLSRVHRKIPFELPGKAERFKIFKKKMELYLFNDHRTITRDGEDVEVYLTVDSAIDDAYLTKIAEATEGFSGRAIDQAVAEMRLRAYRSGNNVVTPQIFDMVVKDKAVEVEKERLTAEYQRQRQQQKLNGQMPVPTAPVATAPSTSPVTTAQPVAAR
jgi:ATPase family AAA domain-containing protein 3A/B